VRGSGRKTRFLNVRHARTCRAVAVCRSLCRRLLCSLNGVLRQQRRPVAAPFCSCLVFTSRVTTELLRTNHESRESHVIGCAVAAVSGTWRSVSSSFGGFIIEPQTLSIIATLMRAQSDSLPLTTFFIYRLRPCNASIVNRIRNHTEYFTAIMTAEKNLVLESRQG
jgi:hypothetical protein